MEHPAHMEHPAAPSPNGAGHEHREVNVRFIVISLITLLIGTFMVCLLVIGIFRYFHNEYLPAQPSQLATQLPPEPRVEEKPYLQLQNLRAVEDHVLNSYAWVAQSAGTVRIPIDKAIDMVAQKGLPSHNYLDDINAGRKTQGSNNAKQ
ncbi:MAG TPA: hypothetical protein VH157_02650 [Bryobacteraceae bacterium]|nr:hypothetical protein [Bryobacteraceae bacterium]